MNARRLRWPVAVPPSVAGPVAGAAAAGTRGEWLMPLHGHWVDAARRSLTQHAVVVRVTVVSVRGSSPREAGASLLLDASGTQGTIGGGQLEWQATRDAQELLCGADAPAVRIRDLTLGPDLGQCCGGRVELWLERLTRRDLPWLRSAARRLRAGGPVAIATDVAAGTVTHRLLRAAPVVPRVHLRRDAGDRLTLVESAQRLRRPLWIFGAGHVGQALVRLLSALDSYDITWIDSRAALLPPGLPLEVTIHACAAPAERLADAAAGTHYVVLTHDHALDYELCRAVLRRGDAAWLGLIGSASKAARFRARLLRDGLSPVVLNGLTCPIGIEGINSKVPAAIAIAIAAQLLQRLGTESGATAGVAASACGACGAAGSCRVKS